MTDRVAELPGIKGIDPTKLQPGINAATNARDERGTNLGVGVIARAIPETSVQDTVNQARKDAEESKLYDKGDLTGKKGLDKLDAIVAATPEPLTRK